MAAFDKSNFEDAIVTACKKHFQEHWEEQGYRTFLSIDIDNHAYFVKYGSYKRLWPEIQTQLHVAAYAESLVGTPSPRIPKILHYFRRKTEIEVAYLVMEKIKLSHSPPDLHERTLEAITWLATVPAPEGHVLGPLGGGCIRHSFFKDSAAPYPFPSIQALERYVNQVYPCLYFLEHQKDQEFVSITNEKLILMQPDMDDTNFAVDEEGRTVLMDFGEIAWLPESFAVFTLTSNKKSHPVIKALCLSGGYNMALMGKITRCLGIVADPTLGLDANGFPETGNN